MSDSPLIGKEFNGFRVESLLGQGGMGAVYKAQQLKLNRPVAIKVIEGISGAHLQQFRIRFEREAQAAAKVSHPNIVQVYDYGEIEGQLYLVMEYVQGQGLDELMRERRRLPEPEALDLIRQAAVGLGVAHGAGIVHRDIKPANLMLDKHGIVKVADFGLATGDDSFNTLTRTGQILGTPAYMAPEQMEGDKVDHRADLYSLGITLFEMVTGKRPFSGETPIALISKRMKKSIVDASEVREDTPKVVRELLLKMMGVARDERHQSAAELVADIDATTKALTGETVAAPVDLPEPSPSIILDTPDPSLLIVDDINVLSSPDSAVPTDAPPLTPAPAGAAKKGSPVVPLLVLVLLAAAATIGWFLMTQDKENAAKGAVVQQPAPAPAVQPATQPEPSKDDVADDALSRVQEFERVGADTEAILGMLKEIMEQHQGTPAAVEAEQKIIKIEVTIIIQRADEALQSGDIAQAKVIVAGIPDADIAKALAAEINGRIVEAERAALAEQVVATAKVSLQAAAQACDRGDWAGARTAARVLDTSAEATIALFVRIEAGERRDAALAESAQARGTMDWAAARAALEGVPDDALLAAERSAIDLGERLQTALRVAREALEADRPGDALTALEGMPDSEPSVQLLREAATLAKRIRDGLAEAVGHREAGRLEQAKGVLESLPSDDPRVRALLTAVKTDMTQRSAAAAASAKATALKAARAAVEQAKRAIAAGNWDGASEELRKARTSGAAEVSAELAQLEKSIRDAQAAWKRAQAAAEAGRNDEARAALEKLKAISPEHQGSSDLSGDIKDLSEGLRESGQDNTGHALFRNVKDGAILVRVAGGSFPMGRKGGGDEGPSHRTKLSSFLIDRDEVTNRRYSKFLKWQSSARKAHEFCHRDEPPEKDHTPKFWDESGWSDPGRPVVGVDWYDAYAYARWAGMSLPMEAQWEAAARGSRGNKFPWGNGSESKRANVGERHLDITKVKSKHWRSRMDRVASWAVTTDTAGASPRGNSWCGARDLCGNVWEWCLDVYDPKAYDWRIKRNKPDPLRRGEGDRVVRGGSWYLPLSQATSTNRFRLPPVGGNDRTGIRARSRDVGFRCVRRE